MEAVVNAIKEIVLKLVDIYPAQTAIVVGSVGVILLSWFVISRSTILNPILLHELCIKDQMGLMLQYRSTTFELLVEGFDEAYNLDQDDHRRKAYKNILKLCLNDVEKIALEIFRHNGLHSMDEQEAATHRENKVRDFNQGFISSLEEHAPGWFPDLKRNDYADIVMNKQIYKITDVGKKILKEARDLAIKWHTDKKYVRSKIKDRRTNLLG